MSETPEQELARLRAENAALKAECLRTRRQELMEHLLKHEFVSEEQIRSDLQQVGITLYREDFLVVYVNVLVMPPPPVPGENNTWQPAPDFRSRYEDGIGDLLAQAWPDYYCASCRYGEGVIGLLQMDHEKPVVPGDVSFIQNLNRQALWLADTLNRQEWMEVFIALSRPHQGIGGIADAHSEIQQITSYRTVMGIDVPSLCYHDFEMAEKKQLNDFRTLELERACLSGIELGDFEQARSALKQMVELEFQRSFPSLETLQARLSAKMGLLLIALDRFQDEDPEIYQQVQEMQTSLIHETLTVETLLQKIDQVFDWIAACTAKQTPKWLPMVLRYVDENHTNTELNVASIGEAFGLNPAYLSREVKRCTGTGLLDLLQKTRLDHAVTLLGQGSSMAAAARISGFGDARTLRRALKRYQAADS